MSGKHVPSTVPGQGPASADTQVSGHIYGRAQRSGADATADMRDGDSDTGSVAPAPTAVAASSATMAGRGSGTP